MTGEFTARSEAPALRQEQCDEPGCERPGYRIGSYHLLLCHLHFEDEQEGLDRARSDLALDLADRDEPDDG